MDKALIMGLDNLPEIMSTSHIGEVNESDNKLSRVVKTLNYREENEHSWSSPNYEQIAASCGAVLAQKDSN